MRAKLALLGFFFFVSQALADAKIPEIKVQIDGERVLVSFALKGAFDHRLWERVDSGLPTSFVYQIELDRDRQRWWDKKLVDATLEVVAMYDAVARSYTVNCKLNDKLIESKIVRDHKALEEAMTTVDRLPIFEVADLPKGERALIKIQAETGSRTLLSFIPVAIKTEWQESPKFRAPQKP
jgi:Domain of unknown function (DUF4390)